MPLIEPTTSLAADVQDDKLLSLSERQYLWNIEHLAFLVEENVFRPLAAALVDGHWDHISGLCASDFAGRWPVMEQLQEFHSDAVSVHRGQFSPELRDSKDLRAVSTDGFIAGLQEFRRLFDSDRKSCSASIGLVRFSPVDRKRLEQEWRSTWKLRMAGRRGDRRVELVLSLALLLDAPSEDVGQRQQWIRSAVVESVQISESNGPLMRETTGECGFDLSQMHDNWNSGVFKHNTGGVFLADYDQDGAEDVLLLNVATGATLYRGDGRGKFADVTDPSGLLRRDAEQGIFLAAACWADLDEDADEDLILFDRVWENRGDGSFRDVTAKSNLLLGPASGYAVADYDRDGRVDLYVCHSEQYMIGQRRLEKVPWIDGTTGIDNVLWRNLGNWQFEDVTWKTKTDGGGLSCFAAVWFDANGDLRPDLMAINEFGRNALMVQQPDGTFSRGDVDPVFGGLSMGVTTGDFDNDGLTDLYLANMYSKAGNRIFENVNPAGYPADLLAKIRESTTGSKLYRSMGNGDFEVVAGSPDVSQVGWTYGTNFADFDADGWLDLYATAGFKSVKRGKPDG